MADDDITPPPQFGPGRCVECHLPLSIYNGYKVCGPCRRRLGVEMEGRFPRREPVRPVTLDTGGVPLEPTEPPAEG